MLSLARGDFHQGSDLDLIIIKETSKKFPDRIEEVLGYVPGGIAVEPRVYTPEEIAKNAVREKYPQRKIIELLTRSLF
jgi:hypothetical protein